MSEQITLDKIEENLSFIESKYDAARLVDPVSMRILECKENGICDIDKESISSWKNGVITENSLAVRAYHENKSFFKLEQRPEQLIMMTAIPLKTEDKPAILELLINATDVLMVGGGGYNDGQLVRDIMSDVNDLLIQDGLTSLYNRRFIDERLPDDIADAGISEIPLSVIFIDVDDLKKINDTYGHIAGDLALKEIGAAIQRNIRLENDWAARYGGDEFLVSLHNVAYDEAYQIAERIREEIEKITVSVPEGNIPLAISLGVYTLKGSSLTSDEVISLVDRRMYQAKENGKNCTVGR